MILTPFLWTLVLLWCCIVTATNPLSDECERECESAGATPVCGDDGRTYESECELEVARCRGLRLEIKHQGKCTEPSSCASRRALLLRSPGLFAPECEASGGYKPVQCHSSYCWCVDAQGRPVRGTSTKNARPACHARGKKNNQRRSYRRKKGCGPSDRVTFNSNLIKIFESEYNRVPHSSVDGPKERRVASWKFEQLDQDGDGSLQRPEMQDLRRMARRIVPPRTCARAFAKLCDLDLDRRISRAEWALCIGVDMNTGQLQVGSWKREDSMPQLHEFSPTTDQEVSQEEAEPQDCASARAAALEVERQAPGAGTYVPECAASGLYARAQCHRSPPYCWCVHPRTGRPVRGTATQGVRPDCEVRTKNFKGCSLHKKQEFLDELILLFTKEMQEDAKNKSIQIPVPSAEKAARWKFSESDVNTNEVLDKVEWKAFRNEWKTLLKDKRRLRKCWRNLPRFCDENDDQKITIDEWLACTVTTRDSRRNIPRNSRKGKNPLTTILKSD